VFRYCWGSLWNAPKKKSETDRPDLLDLFGLRYEIELELVFGIIFGVVIQHLRIGIRSYS